MRINTTGAKSANHGLPDQLENGWKLKVETYKDFEDQGIAQKEVDSWYDAHGDIKAIYSYESEEGDESARVGIEFNDGRLAIYGCNKDIDNCDNEAHFVKELTDLHYNS